MQVSIFRIAVAEIDLLFMAPGISRLVKPWPQFFQPTAQRKIEQGKKVQHAFSLRAEATINKAAALAMNENRTRVGRLSVPSFSNPSSIKITPAQTWVAW
jgi:hypothetical protein